MHIRDATLADIPDMHRVRTRVRENKLADPTRVLPHHYRAMLVERGRGWVAECDGRLVGFAIADLEDSRVWTLFVEPTMEKKGVGVQLHDAMMEWAFLHTERMWLSTDPGTRAERFYRRACRRRRHGSGRSA